MADGCGGDRPCAGVRCRPCDRECRRAGSGPVHLLHPESVARRQDAFADPRGAGDRDLCGDPVEERANWERHDPCRLRGGLRDTQVLLSWGDGEVGPLDGLDTKAFDRVLTVSLEGEPHQPAYWERELHRSLPMLLAALR